jgi:hypothetical protein
MSPSETIESLLQPALRVSRPVAACSRCRSAKIKCTWGTAACAACERSNKVDSCTSANEEFARGNERSYVAALEAAVERLQRNIENTQATNIDMSRADASQRNSRKHRKISGNQRREATDVNELVSDFGFLTVNATSRDFHGFTSTMSFAKLLLAMAVKTDLSLSPTVKLPPRHAVMQASERYFNGVFGLLPFFSETEFITSLSRVYQDAASTPVAPLDFWYVRLVLAISYATQSRGSDDDNGQQAFRHMAAAMQLAEHVLRPGIIGGVQALLLLVQYALVDSTTFDVWYLIGMAARLVVDLGLHCDPAAETRISREDLNMRRRVFHTTYALDRFVSISLGKPFSFTDDSATAVPLPEFGNERQAEEVTSPFLHSIRPCLYLFDIRRVQSTFYQTTRYSSRSTWSQHQASSYSNATSNDIRAWYSGIPSSLSHIHLTFFNLERLFSHILVFAPHQRRPLSDMSELDKGMIFEYCSQYAELLYPITSNVGYLPFYTCMDLHRARWVGKQFLDVMWSDFDRLLRSQQTMAGRSTENSSVYDNASRALTCLRRISDILSAGAVRWQMQSLSEQFERESAVLLGRLSNRQQEAAPQPVQAPQVAYVPQMDAAYTSYFPTDMAQFQPMPSSDGHRISPGTRRVYEFMGGGQQQHQQQQPPPQ